MATKNEFERACTECGEVLSDSAKFCPGCGQGRSWGKGSLKTKIAEKMGRNKENVQFEPAPQNCQWGNGNQCAYPANVSHSISGGGPYYCRFHVWPSDHTEAVKIAVESRNKQKQIEYFTPAKVPNIKTFTAEQIKAAEKTAAVNGGRAWALRIIKRYRAGQNVEWYPLKLSMDALRIDVPSIIDREPGCDDEEASAA